MRKTSLAKAKAHLSALVDEAEHKRRRIVILRHGKPSAALVPVEAAVAHAGSAPVRLSARKIAELFSAFGKARTSRSAVADLLAGRR